MAVHQPKATSTLGTVPNSAPRACQHVPGVVGRLGGREGHVSRDGVHGVDDGRGAVGVLRHVGPAAGSNF